MIIFDKTLSIVLKDK